ncbi:antigen WC1.1-like [Triplophysa rosa]|nr:antigen WC1.1-like [Triplophysa rosa]
MGALKILTLLPIISLWLWLGCNNFVSAKHPNVAVNIKFVSELNEHSGWCSWTLSSSEDKATMIVPEEIMRLSSEICLSLGCGDVYKIRTGDEGFNNTCLTGCLYHSTELNCSGVVRNGCKTLSEVVCGSPYVVQAHSSCSWTIKSPDSDSSFFLAADVVQNVSIDICHQLGCGEPYNLIRSSAGINKTCLTNCVYQDYHLKHCTEITSSDCSLLSELQCGNAAVRLVGGGHHCGGRVEVWRGSWGTVCDDGWDEEDADVVCAQLGCGYAVSVSGMGEPYGQGTGPIHLDELNCTGRERNLWECPAISQDHDCGHKEDAGVVCSEYKALRLTGGLDRCSGRVEFHHNGTWGTVCDTCWQKEEAAMACGMLKCGAVRQFTAFDPPFMHKNETLWYFLCLSDNLWQCQEFSNHPLLCKDSKAAGLICNNSLGMPVQIYTSPVPNTTTTKPVTMKKNILSGFNLDLSPEQMGCLVLALLLLTAIITNIILCCHANKKKKAVEVQQKFANLQTAPEAEDNNYRDSVHLVKVTNNCSESEVPIIPQRIWPQSSVESGSYDTDYEQHDISPEAPFPLSTFRNSMRYSADGKTATVKAANLNSVTEEVDSFESSSTSSGECNDTAGTNEKDLCSLASTECYENTGLNTADNGTHLREDFSTQDSGKSCLGHPTDSDIGYQVSELDNGDVGREDSPIYSPVTYENDAVSCESE